ncbi:MULTISPECIES: ankyrin repeat domain-containing protein [unclassified Nesterenkonia]|uniref:ankyrin repeat domain-containing protein n=1 Tax=unclassified Nesterenkonia TaxID=2629769 RepID=UPI002102A26F|nr:MULTISPECIES: ankyrin repeat domain-containing protein [unclassified Nesterenkonia]
MSQDFQHAADHSENQQPPAGGAPELTEEQMEFLASMFGLARAGKTEELLDLVDRGVPVNLSNEKGDTLLILSVYNDHTEQANGLLTRGADVDRINDQGQTALGCAVFRQNEVATKALLAAGADPRLGRQSAYAVAEIFGLDAMRAILDAHSG